MKPAAAGLGVAALAAVAFNYQSGENTELFMNHRLSQTDYDFMKYVSDFGKSYGTKAEYEFRKEQWEKTDKAIVEEMSQNGNTFTLAHNQFSTWTAEEYKRLLGYKPEMRQQNAAPVLLSEENLADAVDWRTKGAVTKVKNQEQCGSCWAFSATGSIEGAMFISSGTLTSLSEQQLVDCDKQDSGCKGGLMDYAFEYVEKHPLETEAEYPYIGRKHLFGCQAKEGKGVGKVSGYKDVTPDSADQLKAAVMQQPVSVAVEADKSVFQNYHSGVLNSASCGTNLDHGVLAVGYGTEGGQDYFIVKNSWGASWGDQGYLKISASADNICGILSQPSYPTE